MTGWTGKLTGMLAGMIVVGLLAAGAGCGSTMQGDAPALDNSRGTARAVSLGEAIQEVDALPAPDGVNPAVFQQLQDELIRVLQAQGVERFVSDAPQSQGSAVNDLMISNNPDGSADLAWTYRNQGDGDLNSEVNIADLTPIGIHLGKTGAVPDWNRARNTDNDGNNEVNISDITPIGSNFLNKVQGYWIQRAVNPDSTWNLVSQVVFADSSINSETFQRDFSFRINVPADGQYYRVAPYDGSAIGIPSNHVQAASFVLPGKPGNVSATQGTLLEQVDLSWDPVADVEYYEIQRRTGTLGSFEHLFDTPDAATGYSDTDVVTGQHYFYIVRGWQGEKKTDYSIQFEGWPLDRPAMPTNLMASDGTSPAHVSVTWEAAAGADEYVLYHSLEEDGTYTELLRTTDLSYDDTGAALESLNWYYVTASNTAGESNQSNKDSGYRDGAVPVIDSVSPLGGLAGDSIQMLAVTSGASVNSWSWDFGGGATPGTSTDESPMITLAGPGVYDCSLTVDGNLDSDTFDFQLTVTTDEWVHTLGGPVNEEGMNVGADDDGNVYLIGKSSIPIVTKYDQSGILKWSKAYNASINTPWVAGAVASNGDVVVVAGNDASNQPSEQGVLILRLDSNGEIVFSKIFDVGETLTRTHYPRVVMDGSGNSYIAITGEALAEPGKGTLHCMKLDSTGTPVWNGHYETTSIYSHDKSLADGIVVDSAGNMYIGADEANVTKLDVSGTVLWCKGWGDVQESPHEHAYTMAIDSSNYVYLAGGVNTESSYRPFIVKFDQSGTIAWQKSFASGAGSSSAQIVYLRIDGSGTVYAINPQREDAGLSSSLYMLDSDGNLNKTWEYSESGTAKLFAMDIIDGRILLAGIAPNNTSSWTLINGNTVDDYGLAIEDRIVNTLPTSGSFTDAVGNLLPYDGIVDIGGDGDDMLVMSLKVNSLPE